MNKNIWHILLITTIICGYCSTHTAAEEDSPKSPFSYFANSNTRYYVATWAEIAKCKSTGSTHPLFGPTHVTTNQVIRLALRYVNEHFEPDAVIKYPPERLEVVGGFLFHEARWKGNIDEEFRRPITGKSPSAINDYHKTKVRFFLKYLDTGNEAHLDAADLLFIDEFIDNGHHFFDSLTRDFNARCDLAAAYKAKLEKGIIPLRHARTVSHLMMFPSSLRDSIVLKARTIDFKKTKDHFKLFDILETGDVTALLPECYPDYKSIYKSRW